MSLIPVAESQFWHFVRTTNRNVHPRVDGKYPYTSIFMDQQNLQEVGRIVGGREHFLMSHLVPAVSVESGPSKQQELFE